MDEEILDDGEKDFSDEMLLDDDAFDPIDTGDDLEDEEDMNSY